MTSYKRLHPSDAMQVRVMLKSSPDFDLIQGNQPNSTVSGQWSLEIHSLAPSEDFFVVFPLRAKSLGLITLAGGAYQGTQAAFRNIQVRVEPEGVPTSSCYAVTVPSTSNFALDKQLNTSLPDNAVNGTAKMSISVLDDLLAPSLLGLTHLVALPTGCGEQSLARLAPAIYLARYYKATDRLTGDVKQTVLNAIQTGYQQQLNYRHNSGGFATFGSKDLIASTWLTAFTLRSLRQGREFINVDDWVLSEAENWLLQRQDATGRFTEQGRILNPAMQGGSDSDSSLTAFVAIALLEGGTNTNWKLPTTLYFLEARMPYITQPLPLAIVAYALHLANSTQASAAFDKLINIVHSEGDVVYWQAEDMARSIEATSYVLLTCLRRNLIGDAYNMVTWLLRQRNAMGGFVSTQDTVQALHALSEYLMKNASQRLPSASVFVTVNGERRDMSANAATRGQPLQWLPSAVPGSVRVEASGNGSVLVQVLTKYHVLPKAGRTFRSRRQAPTAQLSLYVYVIVDSPDELQLRVCPRSSVDTGMVVVEVGIPSGLSMDTKLLTGALSAGYVYGLKTAEMESDHVVLYYESVGARDHCAPLRFVRQWDVIGHREVYARVVDYYQPANSAWVLVERLSTQNLPVCSFCKGRCGGCDGASVAFVSDSFPTTTSKITASMTQTNPSGTAADSPSSGPVSSVNPNSTGTGQTAAAPKPTAKTAGSSGIHRGASVLAALFSLYSLCLWIRL